MTTHAFLGTFRTLRAGLLAMTITLTACAADPVAPPPGVADPVPPSRGAANLVIRSIEPLAQPGGNTAVRAGDSLDVRIRYANVGQTGTPAFAMRFCLGSIVASADCSERVRDVDAAALGAGQERDVTVRIPIPLEAHTLRTPNGPVNSFFRMGLTACLDAAAAVRESTTSDNCDYSVTSFDMLPNYDARCAPLALPAGAAQTITSFSGGCGIWKTGWGSSASTMRSIDVSAAGEVTVDLDYTSPSGCRRLNAVIIDRRGGELAGRSTGFCPSDGALFITLVAQISTPGRYWLAVSSDDGTPVLVTRR